MAVTPYTQDELEERIRTLEGGLVKIERGSTFSDRGVTYNTAAELIDRINYFKRLLAGLTTTRPRQTRAYASKGF